MKLYKCELCGRVFDQTIPHKCLNGQYRKHNIVFTEFNDSDNEYVKKSELDVKENNFPKMQYGQVMLSKDAEPSIEFLVNWEQERINVTKDAMQDLLKKMWNDTLFHRGIANSAEREGRQLPEYVAEYCVEYADALIAELKKEH